MSYKLRFRLAVYGAGVLGLVLFFSQKQLPETFRHYAQFTSFILLFCALTLAIFMDFDKENGLENWQPTLPDRRGNRRDSPDNGPVTFSSPHPRRRNLIDSYRRDASFRKMIWMHFGLMAAGIISTIPFSNTTFADSRAWLGVPGMLLFFGAWVTLVIRIDRYLKRGRPDQYPHVPANLRRLKTAATIVLLPAMPLLSYFGQQQTQNLLSEFAFFMLALPVSGIVAFAVIRLIPGRIPGMPEGEFRWEFQAIIWVLFFLIFLASIAAGNRYLAPEKTRKEQVLVVKKIQNYKKKQSVLLEVNGKTRKFRPTRQEWENIREQDTITVVIRRGALGFDFIEKFGVK